MNEPSLIASFTTIQESERVSVANLAPTVELNACAGVSLALDRLQDDHGVVHVRIMQDAGGRCSLYRIDDEAAGVTRFAATFAHQAA